MVKVFNERFAFLPPAYYYGKRKKIIKPPIGENNNMKSGHVKPARRRKRRKSIFVQKKRRSSAVDLNAAGSAEVCITLGKVSKCSWCFPLCLRLLSEGLLSKPQHFFLSFRKPSSPPSASNFKLVILGHFRDFHPWPFRIRRYCFSFLLPKVC